MIDEEELIKWIDNEISKLHKISKEYAETENICFEHASEYGGEERALRRVKTEIEELSRQEIEGTANELLEIRNNMPDMKRKQDTIECPYCDECPMIPGSNECRLDGCGYPPKPKEVV